MSIIPATVPSGLQFNPLVDQFLPALDGNLRIFVESPHPGLADAFYRNTNIPDLTSDLWQQGIVCPEVRAWGISWGPADSPGSSVIETLKTIRQKFNTAGAPFSKYTMNVYSMGADYGGSGCYNVFNHASDLGPTDPAAGAEGYFNSIRVRPTCQSGIAQTRDYWNEVWPQVKQQLIDEGFAMPEAMASTMENFKLPSAWCYPINGVNGWVARALADNSSYLFDGEQTFTQFMAAATLRGGGAIPAVNNNFQVALFGPRGQVEDSRNYYATAHAQEAIQAAENEAMLQAMLQPFRTTFGANKPLYQYTKSGSGTALGGGIRVRPGGAVTQADLPYNLGAHSPEWYGFMTSVNGGPSTRVLGDTNVKVLQDADPGHPLGFNDWYDWMVYVLQTWPNPGGASCFTDSTPIASGQSAAALPAALSGQSWTKGDYRWVCYVRFTMAIFDLRKNYPLEPICPWITMSYLTNELDWELMKIGMRSVINLGVRRFYYWTENLTGPNTYPFRWSGATEKEQTLMFTFLNQMEKEMAGFITSLPSATIPAIHGEIIKRVSKLTARIPVSKLFRRP